MSKKLWVIDVLQGFLIMLPGVYAFVPSGSGFEKLGYVFALAIVSSIVVGVLQIIKGSFRKRILSRE